MPRKRVLIEIQSDPRTSGRAAEALRVAAGLMATNQLAVSVYVSETARAGFSAHEQEWQDAEILVKYRAILPEMGCPLLWKKPDSAAEIIIRF